MSEKEGKMRFVSYPLLAICSMASCQVSAVPPASNNTSMRVIASQMVWVGILSGGVKVTGLIDGQPVVLREFKEKNPLTPGVYKVRLIRDEKPHGSEADQRYSLTMQDGKELTFYLEALCERDASICYGVSIK